MTYGEKIAEIKKTISTLYEDADWLRGIATEDEKIHWNEFRRMMYNIDKPLRALQHHISDIRDKTEI